MIFFIDEILTSKVSSFIIPFNVENYAKYIDGMYKNELNYKNYTQEFLDAIDKLGRNVYRRNENKKKGFFR